jgi:hypothetical protein
MFLTIEPLPACAACHRALIRARRRRAIRLFPRSAPGARRLRRHQPAHLGWGRFVCVITGVVPDTSTHTATSNGEFEVG